MKSRSSLARKSRIRLYASNVYSVRRLPASHETTVSVAVTYNIPGIPTKTLKFTGPVLADIFQGKITKWSDPQIKALNPGVNLPNANITSD